MRVQITNGGIQETEEHKLSGKRFEKRCWMMKGQQGTILGIRADAVMIPGYPFVIRFDSSVTVLANRRDFKVLES